MPRKFRNISIYVYDRDRHLKQDKVLGKVAIKREDLFLYNKDHWFAIKPVDADSEVQGKAHIDIKFEDVYNKNKPNASKRLKVHVVECVDLTLNNRQCDPYALVSVVYTNGKRVSKKTKVRKKTTCPQFEEVFTFDNHDEKDTMHCMCSDMDVEICELQVSIWHDTPGMGEDVFLGEVKVQLRGMQQQNAAPANAW